MDWRWWLWLQGEGEERDVADRVSYRIRPRFTVTFANNSGCNLTCAKSIFKHPLRKHFKSETGHLSMTMDTTVVYYVLATVLVLVGLAGVILPALPGLPLVFAGLLLVAWADGFAHVGWVALLILAAITALSFLVDLLATVYGARRVGASKAAMWGAVVGAFAGLLFLPIGLFVGPFAGAWLGEYLQTRKTGQATRVGVGTWLGIVLGTATKLALGLCMLGVFAVAWLF